MEQGSAHWDFGPTACDGFLVCLGRPGWMVPCARETGVLLCRVSGEQAPCGRCCGHRAGHSSTCSPEAQGLRSR